MMEEEWLAKPRSPGAREEVNNKCPLTEFKAPRLTWQSWPVKEK
jgi:hypothetical protein